MLSSEEAARRLGIKVPTLYAYVSRGLLASHRDPARRGSLFDLDDIEALAARSRGGRQTATRLATITTGVTQLDQELGPIYRGRPATELAATASFEDVAELLWQSGDGARGMVGPGPRPRLAGPAQTLDRMRWALVCAAPPTRCAPTAAPSRWPGPPGRAVAALTDAVGRAVTARPGRAPPWPPGWRRAWPHRRRGPRRRRQRAARPSGRPRARHLHRGRPRGRLGPLRSLRRLPGRRGHPGWPAARRRQPAGLRAAGAAERDGAPRALDDVLRERGYVPGFGHSVYKSGDPRFGALLALAEPLLSEERRAILREVIALAAAHDVPLANCDLALAAMSWGTGMPPDTGRTLFAVARVAGWAAHYMEELTEPALRFRARAVYSV